MLAITPVTDTYLPADVLGITEEELTALKWVREELASGRIEHDDWLHPSIQSGFNMRTCENVSYCGTVRCIGGWMSHKLQRSVLYHHAFDPLFFPEVKAGWSTMTPAQAVRAIDFWATGHQSDCWALALSTA